MRTTQKKRTKKIYYSTDYSADFYLCSSEYGIDHRLFSLQIIHGQEYADNFSIMTTKTRTLKSTRGNIYDRNGQVLASNELSYSITLEDSGDYANNTAKKPQPEWRNLQDYPDYRKQRRFYQQ